MNKQKSSSVSINELKAIFKATDEARQSILKSFPYNKMTIAFGEKLKLFLKELFGNDIEFDREERFACIHGSYKRVNFEIKTWNGIVFTIENKEQANLIEVFKPLFNQIIGASPICKYDYCSEMQTVYPTIEWNLHPEDRLYELVNLPENDCGCYKQNFQDFYTTSIITSLEEKLLTQEGYDAIFKSQKINIKYHFYKRKLIETLRPDIDINTLYNWIDNCQTFSEMSKQLVKN